MTAFSLIFCKDGKRQLVPIPKERVEKARSGYRIHMGDGRWFRVLAESVCCKETE